MSNKQPKPPYFDKMRRERQLRTAKKQLKRHRDPRAPRRKDWIEFAKVDELDMDEEILTERVMPRDERVRRQHIENLLGKAQDTESPVDEEHIEALPTEDYGYVTGVGNGICHVNYHGETLICQIRGSLSAAETGFTNVIAVGDRVTISQSTPEEGVIEEVLPRTSKLVRPDSRYGHLHQILVANIDQLLIVASWRNPQIWTELIDRYLITAIRGDIQPIICINKIDLAEGDIEVEKIIKPYQDLDYPVILTSATTGQGLDELREQLSGKSTVLTGLSGVGKSTLLTAIHPDFELRTGEVNEETMQGRHTTTGTIMMSWGEDGYVIDTPGIRAWGLSGLQPIDLVTYYPDFLRFVGNCRFNNCIHSHEPDCGVREAVEAGKLNQQRYKNYVQIVESLAE